MKPIEPGCMAWTYNCVVPENNGKIVKVISFIGEVEGFAGNDRWMTDGKFISIYGVIHGFLNESKLLRIDGYEDDKSIEEITKELTA